MRATIALLTLLFLAAQARAEARITGLEVALDGRQVLASLALTGAFDRRLAERVSTGLPTSILYRFELDRDRKHWWDRRLDARTLEVVALYDAVERQYTVNFKLDGKLVESRTVHDTHALEEAMTRVQSIPLFTLGEMPRGKRLLVKAQAELGSRMMLLVIPAAITTDWAESRKFRAP